MSFEPDFIRYPSSKGTDVTKTDLFFAPDPQLAHAPSPESFDLEVDNDKEVEEFDLDLSFKQFDDFFASFRDTIPVAPAPSTVTHSTGSIYESSSQYSSDFTLSDYSIPSEIESRGSVNDGLYNTPPPAYSAVAFPNPSPYIQPPSPVRAAAVQKSSTFAFSAAVHVVPGEALGPVKPYKCSLCPFSSKRKHNLKTHVETHYKSKPFDCGTCGRQFSRKHDLRRHRTSVHEEQMSSSSSSSSSSVSGVSQGSFDPMPVQPELFHHCLTLREGPTPMLSAYPDPSFNFDAIIDVPENIIAWLQGV